MLTIKKYSNRRLYDTQESRYITLDELASRIRQGAEVRVIDARSEADLTQATLAQIILDGRNASRLLPVPLLMQLIRMDDDTLADFFGRVMSWALEVYVQTRRGAQALGLPSFGDFADASLNPFARFFSGGVPWGVSPPSTAAAPTPEPPPDDRDDELAQLRLDPEEIKAALRKE